MNQDIIFSYNYSAKENKEIQDIRNKYLPQSESKLDELKRLDNLVQSSGMIESLCAGIGGLLIFGLGLCLAMQVIGNSAWLVALGVLLGIVGIAGIFTAYPIYHLIYTKTKSKFTPRILELTTELSGENNTIL